MGMRWLASGLLGLSVLSTGCTSPEAAFAPRASSGAALNADGDILYVADGDNGRLARVNLNTGEIQDLLIGLEPARIVRLGDRILVTLTAERAVAEIVDAPSGLELQRKVTVGAEPFGIVASPDGTRVYVAIQLEDKVLELDAETLEVLREFHVPDQPRWLAVHPQGHTLYAASAMKGSLWRIGLREGKIEQIPLPTQERGTFQENGEDVFEMTPRLTGDPTFSHDGGTLAVPVLYVDNQSSVGSIDPTDPEDEPTDEFDNGQEFGNDGYASGSKFGLTRFNPAVATIPVHDNGTTDNGGIVTLLVAGESDLERGTTADALSEALDMVSGAGMNGGRGHGGSAEPAFFDSGFHGEDGEPAQSRVVRSYLSSVAFSADDDTILATMEGSQSVLAIAAKPVQSGMPFNQHDEGDPFFGISNFQTAPAVFVATQAGPSSIVVGPNGQVHTYAFLDRSVSTIPYSLLERAVEAQVLGEIFQTPSFHVDPVAQLDPSELDAEVLEGRRLFYSASDSAMSASGAGVSCATCHFDGRTDGLSWTFDHGQRQTPSLAGPVSTTAPITWSNEVATIEEEVRITSQGRMGGDGISMRQISAVSAFIEWTRPVQAKRDADDASVLRGKAIFERADVACATCHVGERLTDNKSWPMYEMSAVNTPSLVGIGATAPYLHNGTAATLGELLDSTRAGGMGDATMLDAAEKVDLIAYLESL